MQGLTKIKPVNGVFTFDDFIPKAWPDSDMVLDFETSAIDKSLYELLKGVTYPEVKAHFTLLTCQPGEILID